MIKKDEVCLGVKGPANCMKTWAKSPAAKVFPTFESLFINMNVEGC